MMKLYKNILLSFSFVLFLGVGSIAKAGDVIFNCIWFENDGYRIAANNLWNNSNAFMTAKHKYHDCWVWDGDLIKVHWENYCLNAYRPSSLSNVDVYRCDHTDTEQHWNAIDFTYINGAVYYKIQKDGTSLCLNAHNISEGSNLNLYPCTDGDPEQLFKRVQVLTGPPE